MYSVDWRICSVEKLGKMRKINLIALLNISPTSVSSERAFSVSGNWKLCSATSCKNETQHLGQFMLFTSILWGQWLRYYSNSFACKNLYILAVYKCEKRAFQSYNPVLFWYIFLTWEIYSQVSEADWLWADIFMVFYTWQAPRQRKNRLFLSLAGLAQDLQDFCQKSCKLQDRNFARLSRCLPTIDERADRI